MTRPAFPVYIPTKGRPTNQKTAAALIQLGFRPRLVVEEAEADAYQAGNPECDVLVWPKSYMDDYERTSDLDPHPTTGAAHNFAWDHAREDGYTHHWIMDDNIRRFYIRRNRQARVVGVADPFVWHENFALRWRNLAGLSLAMRAFMGGGSAPLMINTRLYCATLYRNDLHEYGIRWRRGLNDDTIVSLDILKTGYWCTAESRMLGIDKIGTSRKGRLKGGMTDFYAKGGFIRKSAELVRVHPDCCRTEVRYNRVHDVADFSGFTQRLIRA